MKWQVLIWSSLLWATTSSLSLRSPVRPRYQATRSSSRHTTLSRIARASSTRGGGGPLYSTSVSVASATLTALNTFWQRHPFVAAALVCSTKASAADAVAQQRQHSKLDAGTSFDVRRNLSFILYGALYQGIAQEFIYNNFYTFLFGSGSDPATVLKKVIFDAIFHNALVCIPVAYLVKASVYRYSIGEAIRRYVDDVRYHGLLQKYYAIWTPTNFLIYTFVPTHLRITVMAAVSFFWMILLSTISSRDRECERQRVRETESESQQVIHDGDRK